MKRSWKSIDLVLSGAGLLRSSAHSQGMAVAWYRTQATDRQVSFWVRLASKPVLRVVTVEIGWSHEFAREFCIRFLRDEWPKGAEWLEATGVLSQPCLSMFNLGDYFNWPRHGVTVNETGEPDVEALSAVVAAAIEQNWNAATSKRLLATLASNAPPFEWFRTNAVVRLTEIAGLRAYVGASSSVVRGILTEHRDVIGASAFGMEDVDAWAKQLVARSETVRADAGHAMRDE